MAWSAAPGGKGASAWAIAVEHACGDGYPAQGASYVVFYDSTNGVYKARNGLDGTIDFNDASAHTVIQGVLDAAITHATIECQGNITLTSPLNFNYDTNGHMILTLKFDTLTVNHNGNGINIGANTRNINLIGNNIICKNDYTGKAISLDATSGNHIAVDYIYHLGTVQAGSSAVALITDNAAILANDITINKIYGFANAVYLKTTSYTLYGNRLAIAQIDGSTIGLYLHATNSKVLYGNRIWLGTVTGGTSAVKLHSETTSLYNNEISATRTYGSTATNQLHILSAAASGCTSNYVDMGIVDSFGTYAAKIESTGGGGNNIIKLTTNAGAKTAIYNNSTNNEIILLANVSDITTGKAVENSGKLTCIGTQWDTSKVTDTGTIFYFNHWDAVLGRSISSAHPIIEHHTSADALTTTESGSIHTNLGAGGAVALTLPQSTLKGTTFDFVVMAAQELQVDPGAAGGIYINGAKQTDDKYIYANDEGESVKLVADGNGDWIALYTQGTWDVQV